MRIIILTAALAVLTFAAALFLFLVGAPLPGALCALASLSFLAGSGSAAEIRSERRQAAAFNARIQEFMEEGLR